MSALTATGRWGLALLAAHAGLLLLPPIPPIHNGSSIAGYALSLVVAGLLTAEVWRQAPWIVGAWRRATANGGRARGLVAGGVALGLGLAFALRALFPEPFRRLSREEGLWEPLTLVAILGSGLLVWRSVSKLEPRERRPWLFLVGVYGWLALEELDYFGIFGTLIGRIHGEYAGALHDLFRLAALGILGPVGLGVLALLALAGLLALWRTGYLAAGWVATRATDPRAAWALAGMAVLWVAASEEAHLFGWSFAMPTPEEAIELAGVILLAAYALEQAAGPLHVSIARRPEARLTPARS